MPSIFSKDTAKNTTTTAITNASQPHLNPVDTSNRVKASNLQAWLKEFIDWVFSSNAADLRGCTPIVDSTVNSTNTDYQNIVWQQVVPVGTCLAHFDIDLDSINGESNPNAAPDGYLFAEGGIVNIADYPVLYAKLGTRFGGNGTTTFGLPNMNGKTMLGFNYNTSTTPSVAGKVVFNYAKVGNSGGTSQVKLDTTEMPEHTHKININTNTTGNHRHLEGGQVEFGTGDNIGSGARNTGYSSGGKRYYTSKGGNHYHNVNGDTGGKGNTQYHENRMPYMITRWIIKY